MKNLSHPQKFRNNSQHTTFDYCWDNVSKYMETIYEGMNLKNIYIYTEKVLLIFNFFPDFFSFQSLEVVMRQPYLKLNNYSFFFFYS